MSIVKLNFSLRVALILFLSTCVKADIKIPFIRSGKSYTPLIFFKLPPGANPQCDAMERVIRKIERELNVHVERMDVARDRAAERLFTLLSPEQLPPLLYHRESLQRIQQPSKSKASSKSDDSGNKGTIRIDEGRVRAWAKGRILSPLSELDVTTSSAPDMMITAEESGIDQDELMMSAGMSPLQRQGREAIRQRTEERANSRKK